MGQSSSQMFARGLRDGTWPLVVQALIAFGLQAAGAFQLSGWVGEQLGVRRDWGGFLDTLFSSGLGAVSMQVTCLLGATFYLGRLRAGKASGGAALRACKALGVIASAWGVTTGVAVLVSSGPERSGPAIPLLSLALVLFAVWSIVVLLSARERSTGSASHLRA